VASPRDAARDAWGPAVTVLAMVRRRGRRPPGSTVFARAALRPSVASQCGRCTLRRRSTSVETLLTPVLAAGREVAKASPTSTIQGRGGVQTDRTDFDPADRCEVPHQLLQARRGRDQGPLRRLPESARPRIARVTVDEQAGAHACADREYRQIADPLCSPPAVIGQSPDSKSCRPTGSASNPRLIE